MTDVVKRYITWLRTDLEPGSCFVCKTQEELHELECALAANGYILAEGWESDGEE